MTPPESSADQSPDKSKRRMNLKVLLPSAVLVAEKVVKVTAEAQDGAFCLLPRHIDFVAALVPGILAYERPSGEELFLAIDEGILVKCAGEVSVSSRNAISGGGLGELHNTVQERFKKLDEREKAVRSAVAKIESGLIRKFLEIQGRQ
jgi:F-type H+-transporting ATPase subunit epsilon